MNMTSDNANYQLNKKRINNNNKHVANDKDDYSSFCRFILYANDKDDWTIGTAVSIQIQHQKKTIPSAKISWIKIFEIQRKDLPRLKTKACE